MIILLAVFRIGLILIISELITMMAPAIIGIPTTIWLSMPLLLYGKVEENEIGDRIPFEEG